MIFIIDPGTSDIDKMIIENQDLFDEEDPDYKSDEKSVSKSSVLANNYVKPDGNSLNLQFI